ncbi:MAG: hypothetical protein RCO49_01670 [Rickettsia endosymbiont of Argas persicus]
MAKSKETLDSFVEYAIAILPSSEVAQKLTGINAKLAEHLEGLERKPNKCHVTLYHGAYKPEDLSKISAKLSNIAYETKNITLNFKNEIVVTGPDRWIDINIKRFDENDKVKQDYEEICKLHNTVVDKFSSYHQRPLERASDDLETLKSKIEAQDENALKKAQQIGTYGVSGVKELYNPHTTLWYQRPTNPALNKAAETVKNEASGFPCDAYALIFGKLGYNGNIEELCTVFPFGENYNLEQGVELAAKTVLDW